MLFVYDIDQTYSLPQRTQETCLRWFQFLGPGEEGERPALLARGHPVCSGVGVGRGGLGAGRLIKLAFLILGYCGVGFCVLYPGYLKEAVPD